MGQLINMYPYPTVSKSFQLETFRFNRVLGPENVIATNSFFKPARFLGGNVKD